MKNRSLIVELAGPAGAGKTTLTRTLHQSDESIQFGFIPHIRHIRNLPFFLWNTISLMPVILALSQGRDQRSLTLQQVARMAILKGWHRRLRETSSLDGKVIILDQGPVHMLSDFLRSGPRGLRKVAPSWWDATCHDWAHTLDMVVCLDAPDPVLLDRIRSRKKDHGCKDEPDDKAMEFLELCRATQNETLASMSLNSKGPEVIHIDTSQMSLDEAMERILALFQSRFERQP